MQTSIKISHTEYQARAERLLAHIQEFNLSGVVLFDSDYILYYTGFAFIPTERPIAFVINAKGERGLFVPRLEVEHAEANTMIDRSPTTSNIPTTPSQWNLFKLMLEDMAHHRLR